VRQQQGLRRRATQHARNHAAQQHDRGKRSDADEHDGDDLHDQSLDDTYERRKKRKLRRKRRIVLSEHRKRKQRKLRILPKQWSEFGRLNWGGRCDRGLGILEREKRIGIGQRQPDRRRGRAVIERHSARRERSHHAESCELL
jgi:hypothetical protein